MMIFLASCNVFLSVGHVQDLCLEEHSFVSDFGSQLEVSAHSSFSKNQKSVCDMERLVCQTFHDSACTFSSLLQMSFPVACAGTTL